MNAVLETTRNLEQAQLKYNEALKNLPYDKITKNLEAYQNALNSLDLKVQLKIANGGIKESTDFAEEQRQIQNELDANQAGMDQAEKDIKRYWPEFQGAGQLLAGPALGAAGRLKNAKAQIPEGLNVKEIEKYMKQYQEYSDAYITAQIKMTESQKEESDLRITSLENERTELERGMGKLEEKFSNTSHVTTYDEYAEAYSKAGEQIIKTQELIAENQARANDMRLDENFDENNTEYQGYLSTIASL